MKISKGQLNLILKKLDIVLIFVLVTTALFTIAMCVMAWTKGWIPDVLVNNWYKYTLGECGICGVLKLGDIALTVLTGEKKTTTRRTKKTDDEVVWSTENIEVTR